MKFNWHILPRPRTSLNSSSVVISNTNTDRKVYNNIRTIDVNNNNSSNYSFFHVIGFTHNIAANITHAIHTINVLHTYY